ncbi:Site-specific recombinase XerC [Nocardia farcinica]|uniref:Site-specific tyrosine recombinase XerC n=1 Tax=Nocardia farcinica TaxID=37329 RepID=A0A0H5P5G9_NOCFR|nr:site-specific integrase [Nocardia farcinica]AXK85826.1 site-specific integrase [Nocardia farcinica]PFW98976.1 Tyrosine recombinase XerC [Nocardia farcinica]PFX05909.1 Tyrosine recombinase XerC [Nocardia farcinica]CRY77796.1 site-specific tyrosine recombinase XerC [Nocardia farcinica]SIT33781.1 Site-specific recombinase XerC [Nocardia farcinica]
MTRGRPPLRIGKHGKVSRTKVSDGVWLARCRFRDDDGVVRIVERRTPAGADDRYGALAERELMAAIEERRTPTENDIDANTSVSALCRTHLQRLEEDGRSTATLDTYRFALGKLDNKIGGLRVGEVDSGRIDKALRAMRRDHGATMARQAKTILRGALQLAVLDGPLDRNPVSDVSRIESKTPPKGAPAVTPEQLVQLLHGIRNSTEPFDDGRTLAEYCREVDLADPLTMFIGTGLRRSELLALRWVDIDDKARVAHVCGKVVRVKGVGLVRVEATKTAAGFRTIPLPKFVVAMLTRRSTEPHPSADGVIFPSSAGTLRDPNNMGKQWRKVRERFGLPEVTSHSFRKAVATLIDDASLSARVGADHLGHRHVSMTQDRYFGRGRQHPEVAAVLDLTLAVSDE